MKWCFLLILAFLASAHPAFADEEDDVGDSDLPRTYEKRFYGPPLRGTDVPFGLGLRKPDPVRGAVQAPVEKRFLQADVQIPARFHLKQYATKFPLCEIYDQGQCGSCVYNSAMKNYCDSLRIRGENVPTLSRQFIMDCGAEWSCGGSFFEKVGAGLVQQGGTPPESSYAYRAANQSCRGKTADMVSKIQSYKIISNAPKSIMTALLQGYPVSVTVGADGTWSSYGSGIYNGCRNTGTNHEVLIYGWDCESAVTADGKYCQFDANGKLPAGVGLYVVPNSWGTRWGVDGEMTTKITSSSGRLCNNLGEEAGILETGIPFNPEPPTPPVPPGPTPINIPTWLWVVFALLAGLAIGFFVFRKKT